jgi:hypothetical protein
VAALRDASVDADAFLKMIQTQSAR